MKWAVFNVLMTVSMGFCEMHCISKDLDIKVVSIEVVSYFQRTAVILHESSNKEYM